MQSRRLPSFGALCAFEAAARLGSFKAAAAELNVTSSAISQRIRSLEEELKQPLFLRSARAVTLTDDGARLQPELAAAFDQIRVAIGETRRKRAAPLNIGASGPVIAKWLLPRLHRFSERYPQLEITLSAGQELRAPEANEVFIRFNEEPGAGLFSHKICDEHLLPLASPDFVKRHGLASPADLLKAPLLHHQGDPRFHAAPSWADWFKAVGLDPDLSRRGTHFDPMSADHAIEAAVNGAGVVLGRRFLAREDLSQGRLVAPFGPALPMGVSYHVVCANGVERSPNAAAFINWAREESAAAAESSV